METKVTTQTRLVDYEVDLKDLFTHLDCSTSFILYALAEAVEGEALDEKTDDLICQAIREAAEKVFVLEDTSTREEIEIEDWVDEEDD